MASPGAVGLDVGGTKIAAGRVDADGDVLVRARRDTPAQDVEALDDVLEDVATELRGGRALPVGVGAAGLVDAEGTVRYAPNVAWVDHPLREVLQERLGVPVVVDNDANTAAWGEYRCGAGRDARGSMVMFTIGTGVGGGIVAGGQLVRGATGLGAELGHLIVWEGGPPCPCGNAGCLEALASGNAIGRFAREALAAGEVAETSPLRLSEPLDGKAVTRAAEAGDPDAVALLARAGGWLGVGIASIVNALDPEVVVIGGGAIQAGELLLAPAREAAAARLIGRVHRTPPPIVRATLGDDAGVVGAALLAAELPAR